MAITSTASAIGALALASAALALILAAANDVRAYEIPNWTSMVLIGAYAIFAFTVPATPRLTAVAVCAGVLAVTIVLFARGWMGGGDVKLLTAVSLWCGPTLLAPFAIVMGLSGALLAALMLTPLRRLMPAAPPTARAATGGETALRQPMPFGVAIALGGACVLVQRASLLA
jgi:prepilin peptidase CpaA